MELLDNPDKRFLTGSPFEIRFPPSKKPLYKFSPLHTEITHDQPQGLGNFFRPLAGILMHDMNLKNPFTVMMFQRGKITLAVSPLLRFHLDGHGLAKDSQSLLKNNHLLFMKKHQPPVHGGKMIFQFSMQKEICPQTLNKLFS